VLGKRGKKRRRVIYREPRMVRTGFDTVSATDTEVMVDTDNVSRAIVTVLHRTRRDTGMAVYTFVLVNLDYRC
jgi:hypothetical protein